MIITAKNITMEQYNEEKRAFYQKHYGERGYREYGNVDGEQIHKEVCFADGAGWNEITEPFEETIQVERHGLNIEVKVKFYRTEIWDSDNSVSRYLYEKRSA